MDSLDRRRPVWEALSDVFLDTETRWYFPRIAGRLAESGYSPQQLERIWRYEIFPECAWNLHLVAGEWIGLALDEEALIRRASSPSGPWARWRASLRLASLPFLKTQWRSILALRQRVLDHPWDGRLGIVEAWSAFARAYLEEDLEQTLFLDTDLSRLRSHGLSQASCEATFEADFRPIYTRLLLGRERRSEEIRTANVGELINRAFS